MATLNFTFAGASGGDLKRLTFAMAPALPGVESQDRIHRFCRDRSGVPKLYIVTSDGTDLQSLDLPDKGYLTTHPGAERPAAGVQLAQAQRKL
jgi:hypothetical protein